MPSKKKGPAKGTGGNVRRGLEGRGATPPAHMRHWYKDKARDERIGREERGGTSTSRPTGPRQKKSDEAPEYIGGRHAVGVAHRCGVPACDACIPLRIEHV